MRGARGWFIRFVFFFLSLPFFLSLFLSLFLSVGESWSEGMFGRARSSYPQSSSVPTQQTPPKQCSPQPPTSAS